MCQTASAPENRRAQRAGDPERLTSRAPYLFLRDDFRLPLRAPLAPARAGSRAPLMQRPRLRSVPDERVVRGW